MLCICILDTNLLIYVYVSDRVNLRSGLTYNLFIKIYLIIKLKKCGYFHRNPKIS